MTSLFKLQELIFPSIYVTNMSQKALVSVPWQSLQVQTALSPEHSARSHLADLLQQHTNRQPCQPWSGVATNVEGHGHFLEESFCFPWCFGIYIPCQMVQQHTRIQSEWTHEHGDSGHCHTWSLLIWSPHIAAVNIEIKDVPITPVQMWKTCSKLIQYYMLKCPKLYETFKIKNIQLWASIPIRIEFSYFQVTSPPCFRETSMWWVSFSIPFFSFDWSSPLHGHCAHVTLHLLVQQDEIHIFICFWLWHQKNTIST